MHTVPLTGVPKTSNSPRVPYTEIPKTSHYPKLKKSMEFCYNDTPILEQYPVKGYNTHGLSSQNLLLGFGATLKVGGGA